MYCNLREKLNIINWVYLQQCLQGVHHLSTQKQVLQTHKVPTKVVFGENVAKILPDFKEWVRFFSSSLIFLGLHSQHMEVPRLGVESELQLPATAVPDP